MNFDLNKIFNGLKSLSPALIAVTITTGFFIFAPTAILEKLRLENLPESIVQIISGVFLLSSFLIITIIAFSIKERIGRKRAMRKLESVFDNLTQEEISRVLIMYHSPGNALSMSINDGVTCALYGKRIITYGSKTSDLIGFMTFIYILQPWAVEYVKKHYDEFGYSEEEIKMEDEKYKEYYRNNF